MSDNNEIIITRRDGKDYLVVKSPVMPASGTFGYGDVYRGLVNVEALGAIVTNPVTLRPWKPASGTRVIPLNGGVLVHTGLPNPGLSKVLKQYQNLWTILPVPIILHYIALDAEDMAQAMHMLEEVDYVQAIELGLNDDSTLDQVKALVKTAVNRSEKPIIVRLPFLNAMDWAEPLADVGADALVVTAPPRGTAREVIGTNREVYGDKGIGMESEKNIVVGGLVRGRVYGNVVKPMVLYMVGNLARRIPNVPIIGAGGIHSQQDARDYLEAGAVAVQVDSLTWVRPKQLEYIARDLGGVVDTRPSDALADEWHKGLSTSENKKQKPPNSANDSR